MGQCKMYCDGDYVADFDRYEPHLTFGHTYSCEEDGEEYEYNYEPEEYSFSLINLRFKDRTAYRKYCSDVIKGFKSKPSHWLPVQDNKVNTLKIVSKDAEVEYYDLYPTLFNRFDGRKRTVHEIEYTFRYKRRL